MKSKKGKLLVALSELSVLLEEVELSIESYQLLLGKVTELEEILVQFLNEIENK